MWLEIVLFLWNQGSIILLEPTRDKTCGVLPAKGIRLSLSIQFNWRYISCRHD